jgi:aminopeptidase-like protein
MKELIEELYLTNRGFITDDYRACLDYIDETELPLTYHEFPSGKEIWDSWVVPQKWSVEHAYLSDGDDRLLSFADHPLHLISYSDSFEGWVSRERLRDHIHTHPENPDAIPWHFRLNYRPWESDWGFCASQRFVDSLEDEEYYVSIDTNFEDDALTVAEHHLPGQRDETIVLMAHLDHTGMANDDLSGVAAGIELMQRLGERSDRRYSYTFLIVQEMLGSAAYLSEYADRVSAFSYTIFLEMLGNDNRLLLQRTFEGDTKLDSIAERVLETRHGEYEVAEFRSQLGNDELILEAPGYEIPTISLLRGPYPEYHTHLDDPSIISEHRLEEAVSAVLDIVDILEADFVPRRTFSGIPSLANPKYDLYIDPRSDNIHLEQGGNPDVEVGDSGGLNRFRDQVFRYLDGNHSAFEIADEFDLRFDFVDHYLRRFAEKNLVRIDPPPGDPEASESFSSAGSDP